MATMKKQNIIQGATILLIAMAISKLVGVVFKIPLTQILTITGMTYFNTSYTLFTTIYALTVTGLATAVARMVAACSTKGRYRDCKKILRIARTIFIVLGVLGTLLMFFASKQFSVMIESPNSYVAIMMMAPAIFFSCIMASYRGYYEGLRNMIPTAVSQVVEVLAKLVVGLLFAYFALLMAQSQYDSTGMVFGTKVASESDVLSTALPFVAAGAMLGVSTSTLAGLIYIYIKHRRMGSAFTEEEYMQSPKPARAKTIMVKLVKIALPVTLSAVVSNLTSMIDLMSIMNRLSVSYTENTEYFDGLYGQFIEGDQQMHEFIYGAYSIAVVIFALVPSFTGLFGKSALPNITAAWVSRDKRTLKVNIESVIRVTSLIALPCGIGLFSIPGPIVEMLYGTAGGTMETIPQSLRLLGIAAIFLSLVTPIYAILQGLGQFTLPVKFMLMGAVLKLGINYMLVGIPQLNISGAAIGTSVCYAFILFLCLASLKRLTKIKFNYIRLFLKPFIAASACGFVAYTVCNFTNGAIMTLVAIAAGGVVYVATLIAIKGISEDDILMLPKGTKIAKSMKKYKLL